MTRQNALHYCLQTNKYRAFEILLNHEDIDLSQADSNGITICGLAYQMQHTAEKSSWASQEYKELTTELFKKVIKRIATSKYKLQEQSFLHPFDYDVGILNVNFLSYFFKGGADKFDIMKTLKEEGVTT